MARPGIQEDQVFTAADHLLAAGVRPTVEKVRQHLGTGSPNTITPMLDKWYGSLARRLRDRPAANDVDDLPPAALNAFRLTWKTALAEADSEAEKRLERERALLRQQAEELATSRDDLAREAQALAGREEAMKENVRLAHEQAADLRRQVEELTNRQQQETVRAGELEAQVRAGHEALLTARRQLDAQAQQHAEERARETERATANDRRHLQEIDRARGETTKVQEQLQDAFAGNRALTQKLEAARDSAAQRERELTGEIAERDRHLAEKDRQLADGHAELAGARASVEAAQKLADANAARASELGEALAASRRSEADLRRQVQELQADAARVPAAGERGRKKKSQPER